MFAGWFTEPGAKNRYKYTDYEGYGESYTEKENIVLYAGYYEYLTYTLVDVDGVENQGYAVSKGPDIAAIPTSEITIPATYKGLPIVQIPSNAFRNCSWLTTINIPDTVTYIALVNNGYASGSGAFAGCSQLKYVNVYPTEDPGGVVYYSDDGVLFRYDESFNETQLIYYPYAKSGAYVMPSTVSDENEYTYSGGREVHVEHTVDAIGTQVFANNARLTAITIPATVKIIYSQAFYSCTKLTKVTFLEDDDGANPALNMEDNVFQNCTALTDVTLPSHMQNFNSTIFTNCVSLEGLAISRDGGNYTTRDGYLCNAAGNEIIYCAPGRTSITIDDTRISQIGAGVFSGRTNITEVTIPGCVIRIGESAFYGCTGLTKLSFEGTSADNALTIETMAFYGCTNLKSVELPANLKTLGAYAFGGCSGLKSVYVYTDYTAFGNPDFANFAFGTSGGTFYVEELYIGENTGTMNINGVFGDQVSDIEIGGIESEGKNNYYSVVNSVIYNAAGTELIFFPAGRDSFTSPDTLLSINGYAFRGRDDLKSVVIGKSMESIEEYAFYGCTGLISVTFMANESEGNAAQYLVIGAHAFEGCISLESGSVEMESGTVESMNLPYNLSEIGDFAFNGCEELTELDIPAAAEKIGEYNGNTLISIYHVFDGCEKLEKINVQEGNSSFFSEDGVLYSAAKDIIYYTPAAYTGSIKLEDAKAGIAVKEIWSYSFNNCTTIGEITIPATVTFIGANAFYGAKNLKKVEFEEGESKLTLEDGTSNGGVFSNLAALEEVKLSSNVASIPDYAFYDDNNLETVTVPTGTNLEKIGTYAFYITKISEINLEEGLEKIGDYAFYRTSLTKIEIPSTTTYVGEGAFSGCTSLESISFEVYSGGAAISVTIGDYCFASCTALKSVGFPSVTTTLGDGVFNGIEISATNGDYAGIVIPNTVTSLGSGTFWDATMDYIYFEEGSKIEKIPANFHYEGGELKYVNIPASVTEIGGAAFEHAWVNTLEFEEGSKLEKIGSRAFFANKIQSLTIPKSVVSISDTAFKKDTSACIAELKFEGESKLETIGEGAFSGADIKDLEIPKSLIEIGSSAFSKCTNLENLSFAEGCAIETIGESAFSGCTTLKEVAFPASLVEILEDAFSECSSLTELYFANGGKLEYIGERAFTGTAIAELTLPESSSPLELDTGCFGSLETLETVYISAAVYSMSNPFSGCTNITNITVSEKSQYFVAYEGTGIVFKYEDGKEKIALVYNALNADGTLDLSGALITNINAGVFNGDKNIKSVIFPDTLETIEAHAFEGCTAIESLTFTSIVTIEDYAFSGCTELTQVELPSGLISVGAYAFNGCTELASAVLPASIESLGAYAFYGDTELASVTFVAGCALREIGDYAFANTAFVNIQIPSNLEKIGAYAFSGNTKLAALTIPDTVSSMGEGMLSGCKGLVSAVLPQKATMIPDYMFNECEELESADINWEYIRIVGAYAFYGCSAIVGLTGEKLDNLDEIGDYAFNSSSLSGEVSLIYITSVGDRAFAGSNITKVTIGEELSTIGEYAFYNCPDLTEIDVAEGNTAFYSYDGMLFNSAKTLICCPGGKEGEVKLTENEISELGDWAFRGCGKITYVELPVTITAIPNCTFSNCTSLASFEIGQGVTSIGQQAFEYCGSLTEITIPASVVTMGTYTFQYCTALTEVEFEENSVLETLPGYVFRGCTALGSVNIPSSVKSIGYYAFSETDGLDSIEVPGSVKTIGYYAFSRSGIQKITLNEGIEEFTKYGTSGSYVFNECTRLENVKLPDSLTTISGREFYGCTSLETVTFGTGLTEVSSYMFSGCTSLKTVNLTNSVETISGYAWTSNCGIKYITIPGSVKSINERAFNQCNSLEEVTLETGITTLPRYFLYQCTNAKLTSIIIPSSVTSTGAGNVFYGCTYLKTIYCEAESQPSGWSSSWLASGQTAYWYSDTYKEGNYWHYDEDGNPTTTYTMPEVTNASLSQSSLSLTWEKHGEAEEAELKLILVMDATEYLWPITWTSSNEGVVTVEGKGQKATVKAMGPGTATISVSLDAWSGTLECAVTVSEKNNGINLTVSGSLDNVGDTATVSATFEGFEGTNITNYSWSSSDASIATVVGQSSSTATVTLAGGAGEFYIILEVDVGGETKRGTSDDITIYLGLNYTLNNDGENYTVAGLRDNFSGTTLTIPETYNGLPVTSIANNAFRWNSSHTYAPECVGTIEKINLGENVATVGTYAFSALPALKSISMPGVTSLGNYALYNCGELAAVELGDNLQTIGDCAFQSCGSLTELVLPAGITKIGEAAFSGDSVKIYAKFTAEYYDAHKSSWQGEQWWYYSFNGTIYFYSEEDPEGDDGSTYTFSYGFWHYNGENIEVWNENDGT